MTQIIKFPEHPHGEDDLVRFEGPFTPPPYKVTVNGYVVPNLTAGIDGDKVWLYLDGRFSIETTKEEAQRWVWLLANAMAIAAGYSCHGENCTPINPHKVGLMQISASEGDPT